MKAMDLRHSEILGDDPRTGFPTSGRQRMMFMGIHTLVRLEKDLIRVLGWQKMSIIFTRFGYEWGLAQAEHLRSLYDFDSTEEWFKAGSVFRRISGLVDEQIDSLEMTDSGKLKRFTGVWRESFEAVIAKAEAGLRPEPVCWILTGLASGFASAVFGEEILVRELSCQAEDDNPCVFEGRPVEDWGLDLMEVKQYFAVTFLEEELAVTSTLIQQAQEEMARQGWDGRPPKLESYRPESGEGIIFRSESIARALLMAEKVAPTSSTVLIQGESGTGKEVVARFIHRHSGREEHPFLAINCAALPPNLLESELFGHVKGSFTGADKDKKGLFIQAGQGTLFLDEIGEMPLELQAKLLRAIQEKEIRPVGGVKAQIFDARIVAATNRDLREMVNEGAFREDLYYRLAVFPLEVTPLRQRRQDILLLARHFLARFKQDHPGFSPEAVRRLEAYTWPGNVRELENWVEYAVILAGDERILPEHLPQAIDQPCEGSLPDMSQGLPTCQELEKRYIRQVLDHTSGNKSEAARILGLSVSTLWRRLKEEDEPS